MAAIMIAVTGTFLIKIAMTWKNISKFQDKLAEVKQLYHENDMERKKRVKFSIKNSEKRIRLPD